MNLYNCHTHIARNPELEIFSSFPGQRSTTFHSIGIHPWKVTEKQATKELQILNNSINSKTLALGEIGLDKLTGPALKIQKDVFKKQIEISEKEKLPVILHCVKSWNEISSLKRELNPKQIWIFHGFNKANILMDVLKENVMISIGAAILNNIKLQHTISEIPNNMLLLETDNSEIQIEVIYEKVAQLKGITLLLLTEIIDQNFKRIFPKWQIGLKELNF